MRRRLLTTAIIATVLAISATAIAASRAATDTKATTLSPTPSTHPGSGFPTGVAAPATPAPAIPRSTDRRALRTRTASAIDSLEPDLVLLGAWTVRYTVGLENGYAANVSLPLHAIDATELQPGATFEFWRAVGEVSRRTGYRRGGVIVGDHIDPDGALAGGICTASTAVFNAAARAGLQVLERHAHGGYLTKYPLGLDAAVAKGDGSSQTVAFRNDTSEAILIRTVGEPGIARVDLYGAASLGRTVELGRPVVSDRRDAHDRHVATRSLARGERRRLEPSTEGMTVVVTRVVRDGIGHVIHRDRWISRYRPLRGLVLVGTG